MLSVFALIADYLICF